MFSCLVDCKKNVHNLRLSSPCSLGSPSHSRHGLTAVVTCVHTHALLVSQGLLVVLETPHSPKGLHLLARHSQTFASAVLLSISQLTSKSTIPDHTAAAAAAAASTTGSLPQASSIAPNNNSLRSATKQQATAQQSEQQSLTESLKAMRHLHQGDMCGHQATDRGPSHDTSCIATLRGPILQDPPVPHWPKATAVAGVAAAVATAHRCLESMLARDNVFTLPPSQIAQILFSPALFFTAATGMACTNPTRGRHNPPTATSTDQNCHTALAVGQCNASSDLGYSLADGRSMQGVRVEGLQWGLREGAGVYMGCCSLVMAGLRHHAAVIRRCMALVGASTRALLKALMLWSQPQSSTTR